MRVVVTIVTWVLCGCGGEDPKPVSDQPAAFVQSNTADPSTVHAANLACLGTRIDPEAPTALTMLNVHVKDFEKKTDVEGATVEVYTSLEKFNAGKADAS